MFPKRVYVGMRVCFGADGTMRPVQIVWEDGRVFRVDQVLDVRRAASEAGGMGVRYTVRMRGLVRRLFFEDTYSASGKSRWFVEQLANDK